MIWQNVKDLEMRHIALVGAVQSVVGAIQAFNDAPEEMRAKTLSVIEQQLREALSKAMAT